MRIAYIATLPIPSTTANTVHVMKMGQALGVNGHDVVVFSPRHPETPVPLDAAEIYEQYGVQQIFRFMPLKTSPGRAGLMKFARLVAQNAKDMDADLVFSRCLLSAWVAAKSGIPVLFEKHSSFDGQDFITKSVFRSLLESRQFKGLVVISQALKDHLIERFKIPEYKIIVAADGADPLPDTREESPFEKKEGTFHAGYIGHLYSGRGIDVIAETAQKLPGVYFHLVGGNQKDIDFWSQQLAEYPNVIFHGHVPHSKTTAYLKNFDVLLAPYQRKVTVLSEKLDTAQWMSPLKIFEYMSSGIPMICSDLKILHEVLKDKQNAYLCLPEDADQWAETIRAIRKNPQRAQGVALRAQNDLLTRYTWQKRAENIIGALKGL